MSNPFHRYKRAEDARMALEQMEGFELAGRQVNFSLGVFHLTLIVMDNSSASILCMRKEPLNIHRWIP